MVSLPKPQVILTHESDLDGLLAGLLCQRLAQHLFDFKPPMEAFHNHTWRQRALTEESAWVSDLTFEARMDRPNWVVFDHHSTRQKPQNATLFHDPNKSAALLCYEVCRANGVQSASLDRLVHLSNVADLFLEDDPDFQLASDYANLVKTYQFWNLAALIDGDPEALFEHPLLQVMEAKRNIEDPLGLEWSKRHVEPITEDIGLVHTTVGNTNRIVNMLLKADDIPYSTLITLFRRPNGIVLVSLRSRSGTALAVAERLQGGGHPNASGATLPRSVSTVPDAITYLRDTLRPKLPNSQSGLALDSLLDELH